MNSIPTDLIDEILSRLPAKSVARFRCVSKLWGSMLCSPYFKELFLTRSSARPRLLFLVETDYDWFFFSTPQPQNPYEKSSLVVAVDSHIKLPKDRWSYTWTYVSGLIYFSYLVNIEENKDAIVHMICNPSTGQYAILPLPEQVCNPRWSKSYLGFDPIDKQFKVLFMNNIYYMSHKETVHHILTLGTGETRWRNIQCPFTHSPYSEYLCINGILYYKASGTPYDDFGIVCFALRSEKFKFVDTNESWYLFVKDTLINYKGKLGVIRLTDDGGFPLELCMRVLEDAEKHEWSKHVYTLWDEIKVIDYNISVAGMTATGEIVLSMNYMTCKPFYVFYFNPERNTFRKVEIQSGKEEFNNRIVNALFVDHVEDLNFDVMKTKTSTSPQPREEKRKPTITSTSSSKDHQVKTTVAHHLQQDRRLTYESANKFNALCLLDDDDEFYRF